MASEINEINCYNETCVVVMFSLRTTLTQVPSSNLQYDESDNIASNSAKNKPGKVIAGRQYRDINADIFLEI